MTCPSAVTPGKIRTKASAAAGAFSLPPSRQSAYSKRDCRTGLDRDTCIYMSGDTERKKGGKKEKDSPMSE